MHIKMHPLPAVSFEWLHQKRMQATYQLVDSTFAERSVAHRDAGGEGFIVSEGDDKGFTADDEQPIALD